MFLFLISVSHHQQLAALTEPVIEAQSGLKSALKIISNSKHLLKKRVAWHAVKMSIFNFLLHNWIWFPYSWINCQYNILKSFSLNVWKYILRILNRNGCCHVNQCRILLWIFAAPCCLTCWSILLSGQPFGEWSGVTEETGGGVWGAQNHTEQKQQPAGHFGQGPAGQRHTLRSENRGTRSWWLPDV